MAVRGIRGVKSVFFLCALAITPFFLRLGVLGFIRGSSSVASELSGRITDSCPNPWECENSAAPSLSPSATPTNEIRFRLIAGLDLLVRAERALKQEFGVYTRSLGRVPEVLGGVTRLYQVDISRATQDHLLILAAGDRHSVIASERSNVIGDRVAIDERFQVRSNFAIPDPPREYLHTIAQLVMDQIARNQFIIPKSVDLDLIEGVYRGRFRYEVRSISSGGRTVVAVGVRAPVSGETIEMAPGASIFEWVANYRRESAAKFEVLGELEKVYLAERLYFSQHRSYTPSFRSLVAHWGGLVALDPSAAWWGVQEFGADPTFGFLAEIGAGSQGTRFWSINGFGQVGEVDAVDRAVGKLVEASRELRAVASSPSQKARENRDEDLESEEVIDRKLLLGLEKKKKNPALGQSSSGGEADLEVSRPLLIDEIHEAPTQQ